MTEEETHGLNNSHHGEHYTHRAGSGVAFQHTHEKGIGHIIEGGNQHTDDAGDCKATDQLLYRWFGHLPVF